MRKQKLSIRLPFVGEAVQKAPTHEKGERKNSLQRTSRADQMTSHDQHKPKRQRSSLSLRAGLAVIGGRAAGALSRRLHLGGGTSIAGIVAQRLHPDIIGHLATQLEHGSILVTGTNGKTTTSSFIAAILSDAGLRIWRNREGSNLMRGIAGSLVIRARPDGRLRRDGQAISILETDEAVMPQMAQRVPPRIAVFTNLFRDQLDRYGEVDSVTALWRQAVSTLSADTTLVLNADDPTTANLGALSTGQVLYFGIDDAALDLSSQQHSGERHQVMDARACPHCGGDYSYSMRFYSHMGHYHCPNCGYTRPQPAIRAVKVHTDSFDRLRMLVETPTQQGEIVIPLPGLYNVYNALAAITVATALQISWEPIITGIEQFKPAFGRGERIQVEGRTLRLLLAKNPTGFNEVLRTLFSEEAPRHILFVLNDNIADGRDISWIWDVDFERARQQTATVVIAGTRSLDLALRLKYAGISQQDMTIVPPAPLRALKRGLVTNIRGNRPLFQNGGAPFTGIRSMRARAMHTQPRHSSKLYGITEALDLAVSQTPVGETLFVVPTYTGLLEVHRELEKRGLTPRYWEEHGP